MEQQFRSHCDPICQYLFFIYGRYIVLCYNLYRKCKLNRQKKQIRMSNRTSRVCQRFLLWVKLFNWMVSRQTIRYIKTINRHNLSLKNRRTNNNTWAKIFKINKKAKWKFSISSWYIACRTRTNSQTKCWIKWCKTRANCRVNTYSNYSSRAFL